MVLSCNHYLTGLADCQQGLSYDFFRFLYAPQFHAEGNADTFRDMCVIVSRS